MKSIIQFLAALLAVGFGVRAGTAELYLNLGVVPDEIPIDARVFDNRGFMSLTPILAPFDTQGTEIYNNSGLILSQPGMRFGFIGADGTRRASLVFSNAPTGRIEAVDGLNDARNAFQNFINNLPLGLQTADEFDSALNLIQNPYRNVPDSYLSIWADTIVNRGALFGSSGGELVIRGRDVNLSRSVVGINPPSDQIDVPTIDGGFDPIPGSTEIHWGYGDTRVDSRSIFTLFPIPTVVGGVRGFVTNVLSTFRYRVGTPTRPLAVDAATDPATSGVQRTWLWADPANNLNAGVVPFVWNVARPDAASASVTNPATNQVFTIVMVRRASTNLIVDASVLPPRPGDPTQHPTVRLRLTGVSTNNLTGRDDAVSYILDNTFGSDPQRILLTNNLTGLRSRPTNLAISRITTRNVPNPYTAVNTASPGAFNAAISNLFAALPSVHDFGFALGQAPTNVNLLRPDLLTSWVGPGATNLPFTNLVSTNPYMAYRIEFGIVPGKLPITPSVPDISPTNGIGRLVIEAENLNLELARIRGQGPVIINSPNVTSTRLASIDAPFVQANLGSRSGTLNLNGVFQAAVQRLSGEISLFSTTFTNLSEVRVPAPPPADPTSPPGEPITVGLEAIIHVLLVDADLRPSFPTPFLDMTLTATNLNIGDNLTVSRFARLNAENLTVTGRLDILGTEGASADTALGSFNAPILKNFTNNGVMFVSNGVALGSDRSVPLDSVVINGILRTSTLGLRAKTVAFGPDSVVRAEGGPLSIEANTIKIESAGSLAAVGVDIPVNTEAANVSLPGSVRAYSQLNIQGDVVELGGGATLSGATVDIVTTNRLTVDGSGAAISAAYRFSVSSPLATLETRHLIVSLFGQAFQETEFIWPGADVGPTKAGFEAQSLARLDLDAGSFSLLTFRGPGPKGALYVSELSLSTNIAQMVAGRLILRDSSIFNIDPGFTVYFGSALNGIDGAQLESLTRGKFKYVPDGFGGGATVATLIDGRTVQVSRSVRYSPILDSDNDGVVNAFDNSPFEGVVQSPTVVQDDERAFLIRWDGAGWGTYEVQYSDGLSGQWKLLKRVTNTQGTKQPLWVRDPIPETDGARTYRVLSK
jgi:hypothetical protein